MRLLSYALHHLIRIGHLTVIDAGGHAHHFGVPGAMPAATMRLHDRMVPWKIALNPDLALGEGWMDGAVTVEGCTLHDLLEVLSVNLDTLPLSSWATLRERAVAAGRRLSGGNTLTRSRRNVAHHYDMTDRFYELFLDADKQYSCAYFRDANESLEQAQENKKRHIAAKLGIAPGMRVLDIGCGWGGMALYLARACGAHVTGITLSETQLAAAKRRLAGSGLEGRVSFSLTDYRAVRESFDRIVSVGMFEHVGVAHYPEFFARVRSLLAPGGVALLHSIGRMDGPGTTNAWLEKYIFPGGYAPALSEVLPAIERGGLWATDIEILRLHYAETLAHWYRRFQANRAEAKGLTDERFCRMWEFFLAGAEMDFRYLRTMVFQIQIARDIDAVPLVRDYMVDWERGHGGDPTPVSFDGGRRGEGSAQRTKPRTETAGAAS